MKLTVNGDLIDSVSNTVAGLLGELGLEQQMVMVEVNGEALLRTEWHQCSLADGDRIEIVKFVGGG